MTTNHRPTLESKRGRDIAIKNTIQHSRSIKGHSSLKLRSDVAGATVDSTSAKRALEELQDPKRRKKESEDKQLPSLENDASGLSAQSSAEVELDAKQTSADETHKTSDDDSEAGSEDSDDDSEDDTDALMEELRKIKEQKEQKEKESVLARNPLIAADGTDQIPQRKSWRTKSAFGRANSSSKPTYTTDKLHSDTHKDFLSKYIH